MTLNIWTGNPDIEPQKSRRLVMIYTVSDGCTYSCENTLPFEYDSAEAALVDFQELVMKARQELGSGGHEQMVNFAGHEFDIFDFYERGELFPPRVLTIDEWFEQAVAQ